MGIYEKKVFKKGQGGDWLLVSRSFERLPYGLNFWRKSLDLEKKSSLGEKTYLVTGDSKVYPSRCISVVTTYFGEREKVVRTLIKSTMIGKILREAI